MDQVDILLFGRITYELIQVIGLTAIADDSVIEIKMNEPIRIVFSKTLEKVKWKNVILIYNNIKKN
uniref:Uncharacterized protein n=1 Tax=Leptospira santarosai serovar Arenal str. MAVJ 401 TaxID=1049976 RepID=M6K4J8_9LEPT|nr:hypothetical protein LEP1GSC063_1842 [Leptospira santarosai serovar Arenal str. MAVJ 401]